LFTPLSICCKLFHLSQFFWRERSLRNCLY
jgi:hypothetical protein